MQRAEVRVDGERVGAIGPGVLVFLCVVRGDDEATMERLVERVAGFRMFADERDRMNLDVREAGCSALVVSQFTLAHEGGAHAGRRGRRPSFDRAAPPEAARALYQAFAARLAALGVPVETGRFAARMEVELVNDGPVTFLLEVPPGPEGPASDPPQVLA